VTSEHPFSAIQAEALHKLQERQATLKKLGRTDQALEAAKDYVLNRTTATEPAWLERNVTRDGYKAARREGENLRSALRSVAALTMPVGTPKVTGDVRINSFPRADLGPTPHTVNGGGAGRAGGAVVTTITPEDLVVDQMLREQLAATVKAQTGERGLAVLDTMLEELTIEEAAERLCVATSTIETYRTKVRHVARELLLAA
jgi:DNA-directed RNA polymerase specialized sigma24 family protein